MEWTVSDDATPLRVTLTRPGIRKNRYGQWEAYAKPVAILERELPPSDQSWLKMEPSRPLWLWRRPKRR